MDFERAFVTGATGLLGSNLVRKLVARGIQVTTLARSVDRARQLLRGLPVDIIEGDLGNVPAFARALAGNQVLFHAAGCYRASYLGGNHWEELYKTNVEGSEYLYKHAYDAGIRRFIHTSSSTVLRSDAGAVIDETMVRDDEDGDDYHRSKAMSDQIFLNFLLLHPDARGAMILPGWMFGPGDVGPSSGGQAVLDFLHQRLPGILPGNFSVVDVRDVATAMIAAAQFARNKERYLVAGRTVSFAELMAQLSRITGLPQPQRRLPMPVLYAMAVCSEAFARLIGQPAPLTLASVRQIAHESERSSFVSDKAVAELGILFRPLQDTLADVVAWYQDAGWVENQSMERDQQLGVHADGSRSSA